MTHWTDEARRLYGRGLEALGFAPQETPHRIVAEFPGARLRAYGDGAAGPALLILPAPFKRPYIWDLIPEVSVVRHALRRGVRPYLLEWLDPGVGGAAQGLDDYADRLPGLALDAIEAEGAGRAVLAGHSLGGTLAAIHGSLHPQRPRGLVIVDAPLAFGDHGGPLARAAMMFPGVSGLGARGTVPGSVVNALSGAAAPDAFQGQRLLDLVASLPDPRARAIHARVERWTYDEFALPGRLFAEVVDLLYREDRFLRGTLRVGGRTAEAAALRAPVFAVTNPVGRIVPPRSVLDGLETAPGLDYRIVSYEGDRGPMLQHLGPLVAPSSHERIWPEIFDWMDGLPAA